MKYFYSAEEHNKPTKVFLNLRASKKAEVFSEAYFRGLYRRRLSNYLKGMWKYSLEAFELEWPREFGKSREEYETAAEYEAARNAYMDERNETLEDWQPEPWDEAAERAEFEQDYQRELHNLTKVLPLEILNRVADLRVLALDMAAPDIKRDIVKLCRENERKENKWAQEMGAHYRKLVEKYPESFIDKLHLHDGRFTGFEWQDGNLVFDMNDECITHLYCSRVVFVDCEILQMQEDLIGSEWLYEEVHEDGNGFIVHVLTFNWDREGYHKYDELTLRCRDVILEPGSPKDYD